MAIDIFWEKTVKIYVLTIFYGADDFSGRWLESGLADEEMALTGIGSCGSFGGAGMDGADKRGRAS